jgi:hypothetical protein
MKAISLISLLFIFSCSSNHRDQIDQNKDPIGFSLDSKRDEFRSCYLESESYQGKDAPTQGMIKVGFNIDKDGKSKDVKIVESSFKDANLHACIFGIVRIINYPVPKDGNLIDVTRPINFYPRDNE